MVKLTKTEVDLAMTFPATVHPGDLVALEVRRRGLTGLFGKYRDDPTLRDICDQAYRDRGTGVAE